MTDIWKLVHAERHALIDDLALLDAADWDKPSTADGWSVHDVAAHLVDNAKGASVRDLVTGLAKARFNFDRMNATGLAANKGATPQATLESLRAVADLTAGPPGVPLASRLVEEIAHGEDIRRALGLGRSYPSEAIRLALEYQLRTPDVFDGAKKLGRRARLVADDAEFTAGNGDEIRGPLLELLMLATGRRPRALTGPGLQHVESN